MVSACVRIVAMHSTNDRINGELLLVSASEWVHRSPCQTPWLSDASTAGRTAIEFRHSTRHSATVRVQITTGRLTKMSMQGPRRAGSIASDDNASETK